MAKEEASMMARERYGKGRPAAMKTRVGIATAVLVGGGSIAAVAVAATGNGAANHGATAQPAAYAARFGSEGTTLNSALNEWGQSRQAAYSQLAHLTQARQFSQTSQAGQTLDVQRGIVVLAAKKFLILRSANGSLHLWLLTAGTKFQNVSATKAGTAALTASASATQQMMSSGNMIPATRSTATVSQTATTPSNALPAPNPGTFTQNAWQATNSLARGDLALVAGSRSHWTLHAKLVLFTPLSTATVGGRAGIPAPASTPAVAPTSW
jgi:hypothetical protein